MARIFITGSADGLGLMAGQLLGEQGHEVVLHARSTDRARDARAALPQATDVVVGDLSTVEAMRDVAKQADEAGPYDAVIHNMGIGYRERHRTETADGLAQLWAVNALAPYTLTALMHRPRRLVYLSSGMHLMGDSSLEDLQWSQRRWNGSQAYSDSKLHDVLLAFAVARHWPEVVTNAVNPGWVPTRMGGPGAPDDMEAARETQAWLSVSDEEDAQRSGRYLYHRRPADLHPDAHDHALQDRLLQHCRDLTGVALPSR